MWKLSALLCAMVAATTSGVSAHMRLIEPTPRSDSDSAKGAGPCYGVNAPTQGQTPTEYTGGEVVQIVVEETVNHVGWIRIAFADVAKTAVTNGPTLEEFDVNVLRMVEDPLEMATQPEQRSIEITIPNYECEHCVLQVIQVMTRFGSNYNMCADIKIRLADTPDAPAYAYGTCAPNRNYNPVTMPGFRNQQYRCGEPYPVADCAPASCQRCWEMSLVGDCCWDVGAGLCEGSGKCAAPATSVGQCVEPDPDPVVCPDVAVEACPNGEPRIRRPDCSFEPCGTEPVDCPAVEVEPCPNGEAPTRRPDCSFEPCGTEPVDCPAVEVEPCPNGERPLRRPDCSFEPCGTGDCPAVSVEPCPNGEAPTRRPDCSFEPCGSHTVKCYVGVETFAPDDLTDDEPIDAATPVPTDKPRHTTTMQLVPCETYCAMEMVDASALGGEKTYTGTCVNLDAPPCQVGEIAAGNDGGTSTSGSATSGSGSSSSTTPSTSASCYASYQQAWYHPKLAGAPTTTMCYIGVETFYGQPVPSTGNASTDTAPIADGVTVADDGSTVTQPAPPTDDEPTDIPTSPPQPTDASPTSVKLRHTTTMQVLPCETYCAMEMVDALALGGDKTFTGTCVNLDAPPCQVGEIAAGNDGGTSTSGSATSGSGSSSSTTPSTSASCYASYQQAWYHPKLAEPGTTPPVPLPDPPVVCSKEMRLCDDGSPAKRGDDCEWLPCGACDMTGEAMTCADGSRPTRLDNCDWDNCADVDLPSVKQCYVGREVMNKDDATAHTTTMLETDCEGSCSMTRAITDTTTTYVGTCLSLGTACTPNVDDAAESGGAWVDCYGALADAAHTPKLSKGDIDDNASGAASVTASIVVLAALLAVVGIVM